MSICAYMHIRTHVELCVRNCARTRVSQWNRTLTQTCMHVYMYECIGVYVGCSLQRHGSRPTTQTRTPVPPRDQKLEVQLLQSILREANEHNHRPSLLPRAQPHRATDLGTIVTIRHRRATKSFTSSAEHACGVSATAALRCSQYGWGGRCEAIPSSWTHGQPC